MRTAWALGVVLSFAAPVSAHMVVLPESSRGGEAERYTLIVPTEGKAATVAVELRIPLGMDVVAFESKPGWSGANETFPIGAATLRWSKGRIPPGEMTSFEFLAVNPTGARTITWNAVQRYEDGSSDQWGEGGPPDHHASTTTLVAVASAEAAPDAPGAAHHHDPAGHEHKAPHESQAAPRPDAARRGPVATEPAASTFWIALAALAASIMALGVAIGAWRRSPR